MATAAGDTFANDAPRQSRVIGDGGASGNGDGNAALPLPEAVEPAGHDSGRERENGRPVAEKTTAKTGETATGNYRKTTAKLPQKPEVERATAKTKDSFANALFSDEDEDFADADFFAVDGVDSKEWRIEKRTYDKQNGTLMLYYNYRRRKGKKDKKTGRRINEYRSGGKRVLN